MTNREDLMYRTARALDHCRQAVEWQEAADEGAGTPETAAQAHFDAAGLLEGVIVRLQAERDRHVFDAKRMERAQRIESATGREYRAGDAA